jgi:hypothetical protein
MVISPSDMSAYQSSHVVASGWRGAAAPGQLRTSLLLVTRTNTTKHKNPISPIAIRGDVVGLIKAQRARS